MKKISERGWLTVKQKNLMNDLIDNFDEYQSIPMQRVLTIERLRTSNELIREAWSHRNYVLRHEIIPGKYDNKKVFFLEHTLRQKGLQEFDKTKT